MFFAIQIVINIHSMRFMTVILAGYDNHYPKGHHRHIDDKEAYYNFTTLENLKNDFKSDIETQIAKRGLT